MVISMESKRMTNKVNGVVIKAILSVGINQYIRYLNAYKQPQGAPLAHAISKKNQIKICNILFFILVKISNYTKAFHAIR